MSYMLIINEPRGQRDGRTRAEGEALYQRMVDFGATLKARGVLLGVESLASDRGAARVSVRSGRRSIVDGPYAEAKEMIGGFFLVDVGTRDEALAIAAECPAAEWASVEVRAVAPCYDGSD
ncbi:MAG: YciI family protein [Bauldia sp.]